MRDIPYPAVPHVPLTTTASPVGLRVEDLVVQALRRNPRRAHLWVSGVLGKHVGVDPRIVHGCGLLLGALVGRALEDRPVPPGWTAAAVATVSGAEPDALLRAIEVPDVPLGGSTVDGWRGAGGPVVLGFAETATALGQSVADALGARCYLHSTRRPSPDVDTVGTFEEGHSHATTHLLLPSPAWLVAGDDPLVLVDDELSTGRTAMATIDQLRELFPDRDRYLVASLVDLRSDDDEARMSAWAADLGIRVQVISLARGRADLPSDLLERTAAHLAAAPPPAGVAVPAAHPEIPAATHLYPDWPDGLRQGGRFGFVHGSQPAFGHSLDGLVDRVQAALPAEHRNLLVLGTEESMYLPLRLALRLTGRHDVRFQSTTRSPVHAETSPGYPVRRRFAFTAEDGTERSLYNAAFSALGAPTRDPDAIVLVVDDQPGDVILAAAAVGVPLVVVHLPLEHPAPPALTGPAFGSYAAEEVQWLLTDLSHADLEGAVALREHRIQSGAEHYAESLPVEYQPGPEYTALFHDVLRESAQRLATAVGLLTELALAERGDDVVLVSLARAGTPVGVLLRRWAARRHGLELPHYAVSIVRDRGIDPVALEHLAARHDPARALFVDGWTGKGAITVELAAALHELAKTGGPRFDPTVAVLADPGSCTPMFGTRDDFLIASACLNSTVSGLVSRTVLNPELTSPRQFHGAKFYHDLGPADLSNLFLDSVSDHFDEVATDVLEQLPALQRSDRAPTFEGWKAVERIRRRFDLPSVNLVKPGVGETTRVLLRRVPWKVLVRDADAADHRHIRLLAAERGVPVEVEPDLPYACLGIIRPLGEQDA